MECLVFRYSWPYIYTMNNEQHTTVVLAGSREPARQVHRCKVRNSNNRKSDTKRQADALHCTYGRRMQRAEDQRNARKAKRAARMK